MALGSLNTLVQSTAMDAMIVARRLFAPLYMTTAADVIRMRSALPAVKSLEANKSCTPIDIRSALTLVQSYDNHFGYQAISKVTPLVFTWSRSSDCVQQLNRDKVPDERLPLASVETPMITAIDFINENVNGHMGLIHGGMTTIIAHSTMSVLAAVNAPRGTVVARSLNMDYRKPIRTGHFVKIHAWLYHQEANELKAAVHFYDLDNTMLVEATSNISIS
ncbi:hypothetical protein GGH12_006018 [Coemansia sp. RSA 1822]|nr:hypothetical protein LPJ76_004635 [Coemansia sp. RSA 638]KAJ2125340.1 hypothetical protein IW147_000986 [Coemansia sp. RSA 720]KAJ2558028.1 hypothetical protein GGH12_006018 [Coemansia sp. RSA 1822]